MNTDDKSIAVKPNAATIYGYSSDSLNFWVNWGQALLVIAGADGIVSEPEMKWLTDYLGKTIGVGDRALERIVSFDHRHANLEDRLATVTAAAAIHCGRALLYDAIRMSRADLDYAQEEREAVRRAAELLEVPRGVAAAIEHIVEEEAAIGVTRLSCIEFDSDFEWIPTPDNPLIFTNPMFKSTYGVDKVLYKTLESYGNALLWIAGSDGVISSDERRWLIELYAPSMDVPNEIAGKWDHLIQTELFRSIKFEEQLALVVGPNNSRKQLLYDAIRMAWADGYQQEEKKAVQEAAASMQIPPGLVKVFENLVESEYLVAEMRIAMFRK